MPVLTAAGIFLWMTGAFYGALCYSPSVEVLGNSVRVIYFHVPVAWIAVLAFCMSFWFSVRVLKNNSVEDDVRAEVTARMGLWFCVLATISGSIFAKAAWNMYWNWDPREISIAVLLMIYLAYFGLRSAVPDPGRRMRLSAVYAVLAFVIMPFLIFIMPRIYPGLHPEGVLNMTPQMRYVLIASVLGFTFIYIWLYYLSVRIELLVRRKEGWNV